MIVISGKNLKKEYGTDVIFDNITFAVHKGDRVGILGPNGAGKTTLLNIMAGEWEASSGDIFVSSDITVGYLKQKNEFYSQDTVMETMLSVIKPILDMEKRMEELSRMAAELSGADQQECLREYDRLIEEFQKQDGYKKKSRCVGILTSMAFDESYYDKPVNTLSGGEKTRLALGMLLFQNPSVLILDEPTNHLDIGTLKWLEQYLKSYQGTIVLVSHDRYFLNEIVSRIFDISGGSLVAYEGNYEVYAEKKRADRDARVAQYKKQQKEIEKQEEIIRRFKGRGTEKLAKRAASREKMLQRMERVKAPVENYGKIKIHFKEAFKSGKDVIFAENLSKSFGYGSNRKTLFSGVNLDIKRGEKICIVGANGIGKTSLIKIINGELEANEGTLKRGHNVEMAYYDQEQQYLKSDNTVFEEMKEAYRLYGDTRMRSILGRFLFKGDDVFLKVGSLSGGEKARLALLKLMLSGANLLLLDEPTNHLDIDSKEIFEDALMEFPGTAIIISHDRYLLSKIPNRILELEKDGIREYLGKYDYYMQKKEAVQSGSKYLDELAKSNSLDERKNEDAFISGGRDGTQGPYRDHPAVDPRIDDCPGMQQAADLGADLPSQKQEAHDLASSAGGARTGSDDHQQEQKKTGELRPQVVVRRNEPSLCSPASRAPARPPWPASWDAGCATRASASCWWLPTFSAPTPSPS